MKKYAVGIDVGGTSVKAGLFLTEGTLLAKWEITTSKGEKGRHILPDIAESVRAMLKERGIALEDVEGAGIGVPGAALADGTVNKAVNLGWDGIVPVAEILSGLLGGIKVKVGNDANVAALGEMWKGGGKGHENVVVVPLGTGIGGGVIINGQIIPGAFGAAGEIGHLKMSDTETECCGCGKRGCLEQYASATGIVRMARKRLAETDSPSALRQYEALSAKAVFDQAKAGDAVAKKLVEEFGEMLGTAFSLIACVVDPEVFVIGGGVSRAGEIIIDVVRKYYRQNAFHASRETKFALAELGNDAGIYGAVKMVL